MSRFSDAALRRAFSALRETDRKRAPAFRELLAGSGQQGDDAPGVAGSDRQREMDDLLRLPPRTVRRRLWDDPRIGSRRFAEPLLKALIEKSRNVVHDDPAAARAWAALVPELLDRMPTGGGDSRWRERVRFMAAAFEANALRAGGDFLAAARIFERLNREMATLTEVDPAVEAKLASFEASLCIDSGRFEAAGRNLTRAMKLYQGIGDYTGCASCLIKRANLASARQLPEQMIGPLDEAAALLDPVLQRDLYICTVTGRINAHCDSAQPGQAQRLLQAHWKEFMVEDSPFLQSLGQCLRGRVFFAQRRYAEAASAFRLSLTTFLGTGRHYDSALVCLFLAETYLALGETAKLRRMAADAFKVFRSCGVARDMLAAIRLLSEAAKADEVTLALVSRLRRDLERST